MWVEGKRQDVRLLCGTAQAVYTRADTCSTGTVAAERPITYYSV
jgi:hypothetical protein